MKILFAVITCNRLYYLQNCIKSIEEFVDMDGIDLMIIDNYTIEEGIDDYLGSLNNVIVKRFRDRVPNELYRAMNYAIKYCFDNKVDIINFIQDDYQFMYKLDSMITAVKKCFNLHPKVGQINCNMAWKRKRVDKKWPTIDVGGTIFSLLTTKYLVDNGFTRVKIYKHIGLYPMNVISYDQNSQRTFGFDKNRYKNIPNGELWFGSRCRKKYVRAVSLMPNQAMMFDCAYVRKWHRFGKYFPPPRKYYLKPFGSPEIRQIARNHKKKKFSFIENLVESWGWEPTTLGKHNRQRIISDIRQG